MMLRVWAFLFYQTQILERVFISIVWWLISDIGIILVDLKLSQHAAIKLSRDIKIIIATGHHKHRGMSCYLSQPFILVSKRFMILSRVDMLR